jgi:hypothetical protein
VKLTLIRARDCAKALTIYRLTQTKALLIESPPLPSCLTQSADAFSAKLTQLATAIQFSIAAHRIGKHFTVFGRRFD